MEMAQAGGPLRAINREGAKVAKEGKRNQTDRSSTLLAVAAQLVEQLT